jgi:hypothetical protein
MPWSCLVTFACRTWGVRGHKASCDPCVVRLAHGNFQASGCRIIPKDKDRNSGLQLVVAKTYALPPEPRLLAQVEHPLAATMPPPPSHPGGVGPSNFDKCMHALAVPLPSFHVQCSADGD